MEKAAKVSPFRLTSILRLQKDPKLALHLFRNPHHGKPTSPPSPKPFRHSPRSYDLVICRLGRERMFSEMEEVIDQMAETRFSPKEALFCRIISFYGRARCPSSALRTFRRIPTFRCRRTIRSLNTLLDALLRCGEIGEIQALCRKLDASEFTPDACTYNILIRARAQSGSGSVRSACELFDEMRKMGIRPNVVSFGTLISALCLDSRLEDAFRLKEEMVRLHNVKPNAYIYTSLMKALCKQRELDRAILMKEEMLSDPDVVLDSAVYTTLIRGLFRAGRKEEVVEMLEEMKEKGVKPNAATFNAVIAGFCEGNEFEAAFETMKEMDSRGNEPDLVSYNTMVMGLCRAGRWREARDLFEDMPRRGCRPDVVTYRTLLDGMCAAGEVGEVALLLEEMAFNGFGPTAMSLKKVVEGVLNDGARSRARELIDCLICV
ncbi:Putative pentatricopeptide repeat-containing protein [Apostasia shenzhenica]|uniref:Pentatricopeptide repeat-containing protein n=1 Tax=Apostasia shenzhenica TaxID=1088818 RepID=A0A2H9ZU71_9ASPA|nr:Putative pentatricopeptide repeat-containing protein [Apostasia shenzhenica]